MFRSRFLFAACLSLSTSCFAAAGTSSTTNTWIPADAVVALEIFKPKELLSPLLEEKTRSTIESLPAYQAQVAKPPVQKFLQVVGFLENQLGTQWAAGLVKLAGGGIRLALSPQQRVVFTSDCEDAAFAKQFQELLLKAASNNGKNDRITSQQIGDATAWTFDGKGYHALVGKNIVFGNTVDALQTALNVRSGGGTLSALPSYQAARQAVGPDAVGMVYVNAEILRQVPAFSKGLNLDKANPLAVLLSAGIVGNLNSAKWLALGLHKRESGLALQLLSDCVSVDPKSAAAFALPTKPEEGVLPNLKVPGQIAAFSFHRDLHRFYAAKDQLFPERTSGLIFFENMMGIFFSGRDLTDDVLAQAKPEIRFVVANQQYDPAVGIPAVKIPAFAVILQMQEPARFRPIMEEAFQKAIGLASFTRGQKAEPGFIIDRPIHWGTKFTVASFGTSDIKDRTRLETRFNFQPTLAMPGNYLIISSTDRLACDLMDAVGREAKQPPAVIARTHTLLELDGEQLGGVLKSNRDHIVRQNMIKEGGKKTDIDGLIFVASLMNQLRLNIGTQSGLNQAWLDVNLKWPSTGKGSRVAQFFGK